MQIPSSGISKQASAADFFPFAIRHFLFIASGLVFAGLWIVKADTERTLLDVPRYNSVVEIARSTGWAPFTHRRLVFDLAKVITRVIPSSLWQAIDWAAAETDVGRTIASVRPFKSWPREEYPLLIAVSFLICVSYCGFIYVCRYLFEILYISPSWFKDLGSIVLGFLALGAMHGSYFNYPYDIPQMFLFAMCCAAIFARSLWFFPLFVAAAYSKETSILLIPLYWLYRPNRFSVVTLSQCFALAVVFFVIHWYIIHTYPGIENNFVSLRRNLKEVVIWAIFDSWGCAVLYVAIYVSIGEWSRFPNPLRLWMMLFTVLLGLCFYQGWIEERRAYLEFLIPFGFLGLQVATKRLGYESLMQARLVSGDLAGPPVD